jgi:tetratricopeptide (TPR) repeat protein
MNFEDETILYQDRAEVCVRAGCYEEAISLYRKLLEMHPGRESYLLALAWTYLDSDRMAAAIECFEILLEKELERNVFSGFAFDELVRIFKSEKRFDRLVEICERVAAAQPDDVALLVDLGNAYLRSGKADRAAGVFRRMIALEPDAPAHYCHLGNALLASGDLDGAEQAYERAVEIDPADAGTFFNRLAEEFIKGGQQERAKRALRTCIKLFPDETLYRLRLGDVLILEGKLDEATAAYGAVIAMRGDSAGMYYNRWGNSLAGSHHHQEAVAAFRQAIEMEPGNPFYYHRLAASYLALGETDRAADALARVGTLKKR